MQITLKCSFINSVSFLTSIILFLSFGSEQIRFITKYTRLKQFRKGVEYCTDLRGCERKKRWSPIFFNFKVSLLFSFIWVTEDQMWVHCKLTFYYICCKQPEPVHECQSQHMLLSLSSYFICIYVVYILCLRNLHLLIF